MQAFDSLEINWINGNVNVAYGLAREAIISEKCLDELEQNQMLRYGVFDGSLKIQFAKANETFDSGLSKNLTVVIPFEITLKSLKINGVSANIYVDKINAQSISVSTVSGGVNLSENSPYEGDFDSVAVSSVSGSVKLNLINSFKKLNINSVSGDVNLSCDKIPSEGRIDSVSANVNLTVLSGESLTVEFETVSGYFYSKLNFERQGDNFILAGGNAKLSVETVSGNVTVYGK